MNRTHYKELYELCKKESKPLYDEERRIKKANDPVPIINTIFGIPFIPTISEMIKDIFMDKFKIKDKDIITEKELKRSIPYYTYINPNAPKKMMLSIPVSMPPPHINFYHKLKNTFKNRLRKKMAIKLYGIDEKDL
jgi:hypothetical protein